MSVDSKALMSPSERGVGSPFSTSKFCTNNVYEVSPAPPKTVLKMISSITGNKNEKNIPILLLNQLFNKAEKTAKTLILIHLFH